MTWDRSVPTHPIERPKVVYVEVPKAGCTSVKTMLSPLKGGPPQPWEDVHHWFGYTHARDHHQLGEWMRGRWSRYFRFTVVREPVARFESYFYGRMNPEEDINEYALHQLANDGDIHAARQVDILGPFLSIFDFVGRLEYPQQITEVLQHQLRRKVVMPHLNASEGERTRLNREALRAIRSHYRADFALLGYGR